MVDGTGKEPACPEEPPGALGRESRRSQAGRSIQKTQAAAEKRAKEIAGYAGGGEVAIHGRDKRIRDKDTVAWGKDPTRKDTRP